MQVELITKDDCPYCTFAKAWLLDNAVPFEVLATVNDYNQRQALYDELGLVGRERSVPQIWLVEDDGTRHRVGGYTELLSSGILDRVKVGSFDEEF